MRSKAGVIGLTKSLAKELGSRGITVNAVAPGFINTDMTASLSEKVKEEASKNIPLKRLGDPEDVANLVRFLASDAKKLYNRSSHKCRWRNGNVGGVIIMENRVVITGLGAITPIGNNVNEFWTNAKKVFVELMK